MSGRHQRSIWRTARGRARVLAAAAALMVGGGSGALAFGFSNGSAGADTTLGGFTVAALAEAASVTYEQPNFPFPTNPTFEVDEGYAATTDNYGPVGSATAATFYPGQIVANSGPQLALLVPGAPLPPAPIWPVEAVSNYPQTPNTASTDEPGVSMDTSSSASGNTATATLGDGAATAGSAGTGTPTAPSGPGNPLASSSSIFGIGGISSTSTSGAPGNTASGSATATDSGISILGGFINIGAVTSTAKATSDGSTGSVSGSTLITNMSIAGTPVTVDANGIAADGKSAPLAAPISTLNALLKELGISIAVTSPIDAVSGSSASRTLNGLRITIDLTTLDAAANKVASLLPAKVTSQLPLPLPNAQIIGLYLGTVQVNSDASPAFTDTPSSDAGTAPDTSGFTSPSSGFSPSTSTGSFNSGPSFGGGSGASPTTSSTPTGSSTGGGSPVVAPTSAVTPVFKGIGTGLVLLGLLAAAALAYAYKRVDDTSELVGPACADGDPLSDRFSHAGGPIPEAGGFS